MKIIKINAVWCPGCLVSKGIWKKIQKKYKDNEYIDYDYDLDEEIIEKYNVGEIVPVVIFEKDGKEIKRLIGEKSYEEIIKEVGDLL
ncbi:MAG: thioredoxin family protein [Mollicutes bacterium]|nr:thioredoxin family protein [Mollicutes bacterium]